MEKIVLSSGSPRRKELLAKAGVVFSVVVSDGEERTNLTRPAEIVEKLSLDKAVAVSEKIREEEFPCLIIGADTVVSYEGKILGKPVDKKDALDTLLRLQGKVHQVYTGVTILLKENGIWKPYTFHEKTDVHFYPVSKEELQEYVNTGEPLDKAGSYGIQGRFGIYVKEICGDYNNVVGLPVARLVYELKKLGVDIRRMKK
ncbi:Maf family protein [Blautia sp. HCP3S3_H10_1]|uniref:Maf family protein n=1 Tax=unclassified Blautia TaxID=2648079 RepID=UPI003F8EE378